MYICIRMRVFRYSRSDHMSVLVYSCSDDMPVFGCSFHVDVADAFDELYSPEPSIVRYMDRARLATLFPKTRSLLDEPPGPLPKSRVMMDTYFQHFAMLNQLVCLARQIQHELFRMPSHKYVAHQVAMLYQCLSSAGDPVSELKKRVEARFSDLKDAARNTKPSEVCLLLVCTTAYTHTCLLQ